MIFDIPLQTAPPEVTSGPSELLYFLPFGYLLTVAVETPVLLFGLTKNLTLRQRLFAGFWLTACTYPIVVLVLPILFASTTRALYLLAAETFAPVAECVLFWLAFRNRIGAGLRPKLVNFGTIVLANLLSFVAGEALNRTRWFGLF